MQEEQELEVVNSNDDIVKEIIGTQFIADFTSDKVVAIYHKNPTKELALAIESVDEYASKPEVLQEIYTDVLKQFEKHNPGSVGDEAKEFDFATSRTEEETRNYLKQLKSVQVRPAPKEFLQEYRVFTKNQLADLSRTTFINNVIGDSKAIELLGKYGINSDYSPSMEVMEIACIAAVIGAALTKKEMATPSIVTPAGLSGGLYRP